MKEKTGNKLLKFQLPVALIIVTSILLVCFIYYLVDFNRYFDKEALVYVKNDLTSKSMSKYQEKINEFIYKSYTEAETINREVGAVLRNGDIIDDEDMLVLEEKYLESEAESIRLLTDDEIPTIFVFGRYIGSYKNDEIMSVAEKGQDATTDIYQDDIIGARCFGVYKSVKGSGRITGVLLYYKLDVLLDYVGYGKTEGEEKAEFSCFAYGDGQTSNILKSDSFPEYNYRTTDVTDYFYNLLQDKRAVDELFSSVKTENENAFGYFIGDTEYLFAFSHFTGIGSGGYILNVYSSPDIIDAQFGSYRQFWVSAICVTSLVIVLLVIYLIVNAGHVKQLAETDDIDPLLGCNSYKKFGKVTMTLLSSRKFSRYCVMTIGVNKFDYLKEKYTPEETQALLKFIANLIDKSLTTTETYGHITEDKFAILLYYSNDNDIIDRVKVMNALINNFEAFKNNSFTVKLNVGILRLNQEREYTLQEIIDRATIAQRANEKSLSEPCIFYDSNVRNAYSKEAEIEGRMESALVKGEFKVFYQPKYNIAKDRIDGAEALVRWYNSEKKNYEMPDEYIPLFEVNGFIVKLDHHIFVSVCKYMSEATQRGERVVPISVNVSRVTAIQPDFINYYIGEKQKYRIPDGFLTLEFTESFAFENYEVMKKIVIEIKKSGFKCSIDDFGSGHSSQNILKELPMDELKLDKFFIAKGDDAFKDETLLELTIKLGKAFKMCVTQEGVETQEDMQRLKECGCDVIQGYYYSRPLMTSDFIDFVNGDTSLAGVRIARERAGKNQQPAAAQS